MDNKTVHNKYYTLFWHLFSLLYLAWTVVIIITVISDPTLEDFIGVTLSGFFVMGLISLLFVKTYPVIITEKGLKIRNGGNFRMKFNLITWNNIMEVKPITIIFFKYLKIIPTSGMDKIWLPLFMKNKNAFVDDIIRYAPDENPLKVFLSTGKIIKVRNEILSNKDVNNINNYDSNDNVDEMFIKEKIKVESEFKNGANWFYWIAVLSLVNTGMSFFGGNWNFIVGLSITQLIDAVAVYISQTMPADTGMYLKYIAVSIDVIIVGAFVFLGYFANKNRNWSFVIGIILYTLDSLISLILTDLVSFGFHLFALYYIYIGLQANKKLVEKTN